MSIVKRYTTYLELIKDIKVIRPCEARAILDKSERAIMREISKLRKFRLIEVKKVSKLRISKPLQPSNIIRKIETDDGITIELNPPMVFDIIVKEDG